MLSDGERRFLAHQRIAHLATADRHAIPHVVAVCFAILGDALYVTIDEKPKRRPVTALKRLRNIAGNPAVAVIVEAKLSAHRQRRRLASRSGWRRQACAGHDIGRGRVL
jgi:nitroimidazol reductase NimA-like FMN-containing flavoprotein (pyridoxamine 5'-phosphate oxidase superfamily)